MSNYANYFLIISGYKQPVVPNKTRKEYSVKPFAKHILTLID